MSSGVIVIMFASSYQQAVFLINDFAFSDDVADKFRFVVAEISVPAEGQRFDIRIDLPAKAEKRLHFFIGIFAEVV